MFFCQHRRVTSSKQGSKTQTEASASTWQAEAALTTTTLAEAAAPTTLAQAVATTSLAEAEVPTSLAEADVPTTLTEPAAQNAFNAEHACTSVDEDVYNAHPENRHRAALFYTAEANANPSAAIIAHGADVNHVDGDAVTPVAVAKRHNVTDVLGTLLARADPNVQMSASRNDVDVMPDSDADIEHSTTHIKETAPTTLAEAVAPTSLA